MVDPTKEDLPAIVNRETNGQGMDVIVMAIGVPALVNSTLKLCKRGGTVNLFMRFAGTGESTIEVNTIHYNEINVNGSTATSWRTIWLPPDDQERQDRRRQDRHPPL